MLMSKEPKPEVPAVEPEVGIIVVGNDPDVCSAVASMVRAGLSYYGVGHTIPMGNLVDNPKFTDFGAYRDEENACDEAYSIWTAMSRARPALADLNIPIEIVTGSAQGKESILIEGSIETEQLKLSSSLRYNRVED
jgi:hypothetical protein